MIDLLEKLKAKKQAKKISKNEDLPHHLALEITAKNMGMSSWREVLISEKSGEEKKQQETKSFKRKQ